jgi:hypothetical protein
LKLSKITSLCLIFILQIFKNRDKKYREEVLFRVFFIEVADYHDKEGFLVVTPDGMGDNTAEGDWGSWNVSRNVGPLGLTCDTDREK